MGKRGPKRTPQAIARAKGARRYREREDSAPPDVGGAPECPAHFDADQRAAWSEYIRVISELGLLSSTDATALMMLVTSHVDYVRCDLRCRAEGDTQIRVTAAGSYEQEAPWSRAKRAHGDQMRRLLALFGLSPADRPSINVENNRGETDVSKFIAGPGSASA